MGNFNRVRKYSYVNLIKYSLNFFKPVKGGGVETVTEIMAGDKWKKY